MRKHIPFLCAAIIILAIGITALVQKQYNATKRDAEPHTVSTLPTSPLISPTEHGLSFENDLEAITDRHALYKYYVNSLIIGDNPPLQQLMDMPESTYLNLTALYKAGNNHEVWNEDWNDEPKSKSELNVWNNKEHLMNLLLGEWDSDPIAANFRKAIQSNVYFGDNLAEELMKTAYTYSYRMFAEKHKIDPNRTYRDTQNTQFIQYDDEYEHPYFMAKRYLSYEKCQFYEYDFDNDGVDEIGVPIHSGAGGMFQSDDFEIFKKNKDGLYEAFSSGPPCSLNDDMRIVEFNGRIYFLVNPYNPTKYGSGDIIAYTIDTEGCGHNITLSYKDYQLQLAATYTDKAYLSDYEALLSEAEAQARDAVAVRKLNGLYSPERERQLMIQSDEDWWAEHKYMGTDTVLVNQDVFFSADIYNDGTEMIVHKGHLITHSKYYDDYNWFQIYGKDVFDNGTASVQAPDMLGGVVFGLHSSGNLYELLFPLQNERGNIVQFWTHEYNGVTYCLTLQQNTLMYTLNVYVVQDGEANLVSKSLFFDEAQDVEVSFS